MSFPPTGGCSLDETIKCVASGLPVTPFPPPVELVSASTAEENNATTTTKSAGPRTPPLPEIQTFKGVIPKEEPMDQSDAPGAGLETGSSATKTTAPAIASSSDTTMDTDQPDVKPQLYCICRSKSSDDRMIGCDGCNDWFHFDCVKITKTQANAIDRYYCPPCVGKNPSLEIVYKKKKEKEKEDAASVASSTSNELRCGQCIGCYKNKNNADCDKCEGCSSNEGCLTKKCVQADVLRKQHKDKERRSNQRLAGGANRPKRESRSTAKVEDDEEFKPTTSQQHVSHSTDRKKRGRKKGWRKDSVKDDDEDEYVEEKPKFDHVELNNRMMAEAYESFAKRTAKNSRNKQRVTSPAQCLGPGCVMSATPPSKYCTEECGMRLAEARLNKILPERARDYWGTLPIAYKRGIEQGQKVDKKMTECRATNDKLLERMNRVARFVDVIKHIEPIDADEESENGDAVVACPVCTVEQSSRNLAKHVERCFVKSEKQTTFGTSTRAQVNPSNLFCETHNKSTDTYCKRLRVMCAEHYKGEIEAEMKICGFPTAWTDAGADSRTFQQAFEIFDDIDSMANCCQSPRKECLAHHRWVQTTLGILECERMHVLTRLDELWERRKSIIASLQTRGDLITLLSNKTTPASPNPQFFNESPKTEVETSAVNGCPQAQTPDQSVD